jgi:hypothetical protein
MKVARATFSDAVYCMSAENKYPRWCLYAEIYNIKKSRTRERNSESTKIRDFNFVLIFLPAHSKALLHHNQMFSFLRV